MHPNPIFHNTPKDDVKDFIRTRGFGTLAVNGDPVPLTAHMPFVLDGDRLLAHLMASNPIWQALASDQLPAVITVTGPDSYISPDWYGLDDQVPTWNYIAVRVSGTLHPLPQNQLSQVLDALSSEFEARLAPKPAWTSSKMNPDALARLMRMIRPVAFYIEQTESTWKLGQNKTEKARKAAAEGAAKANIGSDTTILAALMNQVTS